MAKVKMFGTFHIDRLRKVRSELDEFAEDADVLFSEEPRNNPDSSDEQALFLRNPSLSITGLILDWFWGLLGFLFTRRFSPVDGVATKRVAQNRGLDIEPVDLNLPRHASSVSVHISVLSWVWFILTVLVFVLGAVAGSLNILIFAVAIGFLPILPFAYWTLSERDSEMADNIEKVLTNRDDVNTGCLVVGNKHMEGVIEELEESDVDVGEVHKSKFFRQNRQ